jgi:hypothetical protein
MIIEAIIGAIELVLLGVLGVTLYSIVTVGINVMNRELSVTEREDSVKARELDLSFKTQSMLAAEFQKGWNAHASSQH